MIFISSLNIGDVISLESSVTRGGKRRDEIIIWRVNSKPSNTLDFGDHLSAVALCGLWSWTVSVKRRGSDAVAEKVVGFKEA